MSIDNYHRKLVLLEIVSKSVRDSLENVIVALPDDDPMRAYLTRHYENLRVSLQRVEDARSDVMSNNFSEAFYKTGRAA